RGWGPTLAYGLAFQRVCEYVHAKPFAKVLQTEEEDAMADRVISPTGPSAGGGLYTRQSSGLVRDIAVGSNIVLNSSFVSIPLAALVASQAPFAFPGASTILVSDLIVVLCIY